MNCCDTFGNCTQGRDCPTRTGVVTHAQACHAARVTKSHPHQADHDMPIQFVGPEPIEPTSPLDDDGMPLTPRETRQIIAGTVVFLAVLVGLVAFGLGYGWSHFGADLVAYLSGAIAS